MRFGPGLTRPLFSCNALDLSGIRGFFHGGACLAWLSPAAQAAMASLDAFTKTADGFRFAPACATPEARTDAFARAAEILRAEGRIRLRGELYPVTAEWGAPVVATLDRGASVGFGIRAFGVHLNGYVRRGDRLFLWTGRRSAHKDVAPGKLDNMVAGGQPARLSPIDNLVKECGEEASLSEALARRAVPVGLVRYCFSTPEGVKPDTLFCYDLPMPEDVIPTPGDDECEGFVLMPVEEALERIACTDDFKFNLPLVILDFALRQGVLTPENTPEYAEIAAGLTRSFPLPG
jgi:hypothetical protein